MDPAVWTVAARGQRIALVRSIIARQSAEGRGDDMESAVWRLTLATWLVVDKELHGDEVEASTAALEALHRLARPEDRLVVYARAVRDAAIIKRSSYALAASSSDEAARQAAADAAASLARAEVELNNRDAGSPVHLLALHALSKAYEPRLLDQPKQQEEIVARTRKLRSK